jgi:hypothetical protein
MTTTMSKATICNLALAHVGNTKGISNIDTDTSVEANMCRLFYDQCLLDMFESFQWPFARTRAELGLVEEDPTPNWKYSYRMPADAGRMIAIGDTNLFIAWDFNWAGNWTDNGMGLMKIPLPLYEIVSDNAGKLIYTQIADAVIYYERRVTNPTLWPVSFANALAWRLAAEIALPLSRDPKIAQNAERKYELEISRAYAAQLNESPTEVLEDSEITRAYS